MNTRIDCGGWNYTTFCEKRKEWAEAGFESNIESGSSTIFAPEKEVLEKFPNLKERILKPNEDTFAQAMMKILKTDSL